MAKPPIKTKSPATPSWAGLMFTGKPAQSSTIASANGDDGKNDVGLVAGMDQNEVRAANQTTGEKVKNGLIKLGGTAVTSFAEPLADILVGLPTAAFGGGDAGERTRAVYDNGATQALDSLNEYLQKEYPHYYSQKEQNMSLMGQVGTANFWADKVGNGAGFMLGAIASGAVGGEFFDALKAARIAKGVASAAELANDVRTATKEGSAILGAVESAATHTVSSAAKRNLFTGTIGALGESGMEGRQIAKDTGIAVRKQLVADAGGDPNAYEDFAFTPAQEAHIKDLEEAAGNVGFGVNMLLTGTTNALLLPKVFRKGYEAERVALGAIEGSFDTGYKMVQQSAKKKALRTIGKIALNNLEEATQEQLQYAVEQGLPDYFKKQRDPKATTDFNDAIASTVMGLSEAYGTKAGWENALLGGIIGLAGAHTSLGEVNAETRATQAAVDNMNGHLAGKSQQAMIKALIAQRAYADVQDDAVAQGKRKEATDAAFGGFSAMVRGFSQAGKMEDLKEALRKSGELTPEEFKEANQLGADAELKQSPAQMAADQIAKAEQLHKLSQHVEAAYPGDKLTGLRDAFYGIAAQVQNSESRERKMVAELAKDTGISLDALKLLGTEDSYKTFKEAVEKWANEPGRVGMFADSALEKANDIQHLAEERIQLANMYKALEDPKHRETLFAAQEKLKTVLQAQQEKEKQDKAAAEAAAKSTAPVGATGPADTDGLDDDEEEANTGAFGKSRTGAAPTTAAPAGETPHVNMGGGMIAYATLNPDGIVGKYTQVDSLGGKTDYLPDSNGFKFAHGNSLMQAAVAKAQADQAAAPAPAGPTVPAAVVQTDAQKATIASIEKLKETDAKLKDDGSKYATLTDEYDRASGLKKTLLSPRTNVGLSAEDVAASEAWLKENRQYADRGNIADLIIREYFINNGVLSLVGAHAVADQYAAEQKAKGVDIWERLEITDGFVQGVLDSVAALKTKTDSLGLVVLSDVATLYGEIDGKKTAGTTDLVAVQPDGSIVIIDVKSNETSRRADYLKKDVGLGTDIRQGSRGKYVGDESSNREGDLIQQATYEELLKQRVPGLVVAGRYIFPIVTKDGNNASTTGKAIYTSATVEQSIGKPGLEGLCINLNNQTTVGRNNSIKLGNFSIADLIRYYKGVAAGNSGENQTVTYYTSNLSGSLGTGTELSTKDNGKYMLSVSITGDKGTLSMHLDAQQNRIGAIVPDGLATYFEKVPLIDKKKLSGVVATTPAILVKDGDKYVVQKKGIMQVQYADGTTSDTKVDPPKKTVVEDAKAVGPNFYSRLQGMHPNDWALAERDEQMRHAAAWTAGMAANNGQQNEPVWVVVEGSQLNVYTNIKGGPTVKIGYLASTTKAPLDTDSEAVKQAYAQAVALKETVKKQAADSRKGEVPIQMHVTSMIDSAADVRTDKPLSELDSRFTIDGTHQVIEIHGQYRGEGSTSFSNALTGGAVKRNTAEELENAKAGGITSRYAMRVQAPGGEVRIIGVNSALLTDEKVYTNVQEILASKQLSEKEKAKQLNELMFLSHVGPFDKGRPGIKFIGTDKGTVSLLVYRAGEVGADGNSVDTVDGHLRFTAKAQGNTATDFLNTLAYFPLNEKEGLPATTVVGAVRQNILESDTPAQRLQKLVPSTSEKLWRDITPHPELVKGDVDAPSVVADKVAEATAIATPIAAPVETAAPKVASKDRFAKKTSPTVPKKHLARTAEVLASDEFAAVAAYVEKNLPTGPNGFNIKEFTAQVLEGGVTVGYVMDMAIRLAKGAPKGTGYHEAFHAVFRTLLNQEERNKYYGLAKRNTDLSDKAKAKFRKLHPDYAGMDDARLEMEMLEETMADLFSLAVQGKAVPMTTLFDKVKAFLKWLLLGGERPVHSELRDLFAKIDNAGFKNSTYRDVNSLSGQSAKKTLEYMNAYDSERAVRILTGDYIRLKSQMGDSMTPDEMLEDVLDTRKLELSKPSSWVSGDAEAQEAFLNERNYYKATEDELLFGEVAGKLYPISFAYDEDRQTLKQEIRRLEKKLSRSAYVEEEVDEDSDDVVGNDQDNASERSFDLGQLEVENSPGKEIKTFIMLATYEDAEGVRQPVDYKNTVDLLTRILDNTRSFEDMLRKMVKLVAGGNQPQMASVLDNVYSKLSTEDAPFFQAQFRKAFNTIYADPRVTTINAEDGSTVRFDANRESVELSLVAKWREGVERVAANKDTLRKSATTFNKLRQTVAAPDSTPAERAADEIAIIEALGTMGFDMSVGLLHNAISGDDDYYSWKKTEGKESIEADLQQIVDTLFAGNENPFLRKSNDATTLEKVNLKAGEGAVARALRLATADIRYRQDVQEASGQDAAGKPYFARTQPSFVLERGRDIQDGTYSFDKPWLKHNLVVRYESAGATVRPLLKLKADLGIRENKTDEGLTPKGMDPKTYWLANTSAFRNIKGDTKEREIFPFQLEAKSSAVSVNIPVYAPGQYVSEGQLTDTALEDLHYMALQDLQNGEDAIVDLYPTLEYAYTAGPILPPIEGTHFLKKAANGLPGGYDKDGNPILIPLEMIREYQNSGKRKFLPRIFQVASMPHLNELTNDQLRDRKYVDLIHKGQDAQEFSDGWPSFNWTLVEAAKKQLAEVGLDVGNSANVKLLMGTNSGYKTIDGFLGDFVLTNLLWSDAYLRLQVGSEAWFKDHVDATKRMALLIAAGPNMGKGSHHFAALETHDSYLDAKTLLPITEAQYKEGAAADKANGTTTVRKADSTDAQVYWTADMAKKFYMGIGKLTKKTAALYDKAIAGETLTPDEQKLLLDEGVSLISAKGVYASQLTDGSIVYLKFSAHILTKELTSFKDKDGNWHAKADMEAGHNMRLWMENNKLDAAGHDTSFKVGLRNKNFRDATGNYSGEAGYVDLPNNGLREQMQNPSGKRKIVYPTQVLQLLDEGMQDNEVVDFQGSEHTIAELRNQYQDDFRTIRKTLMEEAEIATRAVVEGNRLLVGQIISTLEASGASPVELAFFQQSETEADFLHSTDLPAVNKRFQKLFLAHYNKGALSLKAPGSKYTLVTSGNTRVVVGPDGSLAHDWSKDYHEQEYWTPDFKLKDGYTTRELHMHGPESTEPGSPVRLAEVYLSEELLLRAGDKGMTLKELYALDEETRNQIITQMGVRIPFQSHHSAMPFKVVGWVPAHYGSVVIAPAAITTLSGADYDIDSLYVLRKEFWQSADGNWHVYGEGLAESVSRKRFIQKLEADMALSLKKPMLSAEDRERYADMYVEAEKHYPKFRAGDVAHHRWEEYESSKHSDKTLKAAENAAKQSAAYQEATQTILEAGKFLVNRKRKELGSIRETQNEVEPLLRTIRSILLATEDRTLAQERALAQATDKLIDLSVGQTLIANKIAAAKKVQENILHEAHKTLGVATTQAEFESLSSGKQVSNYATYSSIMDANLTLITNPANAESIVTPAEVQPLQDIVDSFSHHRPKPDEDKYPYSSIIVRSSHQFNNLVGKANIGPAALANTVSSLLTKHRYDFEMPFYFMGSPMKGYARNLEDDITIGEDGKVTIVKNSGRKANSLSTLVSAMADNAKERLAAKLNLTKDNLMALANLVAMGYGLQRTMLFAAQPAMDILSQRYRATQSVVDKNTSQVDVLMKLVFDIEKRIKSGVPLPGEGLAAPKVKKKSQVVEEVAISLKSLRRELTRAIHPDKADSEDADQIAQFTEISQRVNAAYDAKDLRGLVAILEEVRKIEGVKVAIEGSYEEILGEVDERKITAEEIGDALENQVKDLSLDLATALASNGPLTEEVYQGLARQVDILYEFAALLEQTKYFKAVSTTLSGNKGVGSDFTGIAKIGRARDKLNMPIGMTKKGPVAFPAEGGIYLSNELNPENILSKEHGLKQNLDNIDTLEGTLPENFLSRTSVVQNIVGTLEGLMPGAKEEDLLAAELDAATFLGINGYQKDGVGGNNEYRLANYNHLLLDAERNLGKQYEELLALADAQPVLYGWLKKNAFLRAVSIRTPEKGGTYGLSFNTRQKVSPEFGAKLDEAVRELMSPAALPARHFVQAAVRYLAVKDNFQYKNGSFVSLIPEIQFREFSNELKAIHKSILGNQEDVKYLTGYDVQGVRKQFLYTWFTNPTYRKRVLGLNGSPGNTTRFGGLSNAFTKNAQGLYHIDLMVFKQGSDYYEASRGLKSFPPVLAIKQSDQQNAKILMIHSFPRDKAGQVIKGQAFYEEVPELGWKDRAYYHLNKVEVQKEATRQQQAIADKNSAEAREDLGVVDTATEYVDESGVVPDVTASDYVEEQPEEYIDPTGVPEGVVDSAEEEDDDEDPGMGGAFGAFRAAQVADVSMTPYVKELLANWESMVDKAYHSMTTSQRIALAKGLEDGSITTSCLL